MKPTIDELGVLIEDFFCYGSEICLVLAEEIHALYNPPMKPISELANDEEACRKVFEFFMGEKMKRYMEIHKGVRMDGISGSTLMLEVNGNYAYYGNPKRRPTMFEFADLIRSLGYEPITETR